MARWDEFEADAPALAAFGKALLLVPPAYLATVRTDGRPRVHPVTPIVGAGRLFVFMEPTSPKGRDLRERRRYALHNGVPDTHGSGGELWLAGAADLVEDPDVRRAAIAASSYEPAERYILFELGIDEARCNGYGDVELPEQRHWKVVRGERN
jgi:Pyridoxamine 5'-phosphate oxidase